MIRLFPSSQILKHDETIDMRREGVVTYLDGKPVKNEITYFKLVTNVQPINGRDLLMVPEHDRHKEMYWLYFNNKQYATQRGLEVAGPGAILVNDIAIRLKINYQVQSVENWGTYSRARIMRLDIGPYANP